VSFSVTFRGCYLGFGGVGFSVSSIEFQNVHLGQAGYVKVNHRVNKCGGVHLTPPSQPLIVDVIPNRLE
jgi:hypothetical protein